MKHNIRKSANNLGDKIKELRTSKDWTQEDLSRRSGVNRVTLSSIETGTIKNPSTGIFLKLARAFSILPEELYQAAGYIKEYKKPYDYTLTLEEILDQAKAALPIEFPVYPLDIFTTYGMDVPRNIEPIIHMYRPRPAKIIGKNIGFVVDRDFMSPMISASDIITLESIANISPGNVVASVIEGQPQIGRLMKSAGKLILENNFGRFQLNSAIKLFRVNRVNKVL